MNSTPFTFDQRLDTDFLNSIYEGDTEHAWMVFGQFLQVAPVQMQEIDESYTAGTVEKFREKVHKLKPVFSFVGLTQLTSKAEVLEKKCKVISRINDVEDLYIDFKTNYSQSIHVVENELQRLKAGIN